MEDNEPSIILTDTVRSFASEALLCEKCGANLKSEINNFLDNANQKTISFELVKKIYRTLRTESEDVYLHNMLADSDVFFPTAPPPIRNPELEARINKLKMEQANREYKEMTKNVDLKEKYKGGSFGQEIKSMNRQLIAVFNFVVTVLGAFAFGFKAVEYSVGYSLALQMMCGLIFATIVFFADLYFLVKYST